jgi:hypothetical protein
LLAPHQEAQHDQILDGGDLQVAARAVYHQRPSAVRLDCAGFIGHRRVSLQRAPQRAGAEHLRRLREPQPAAVHRPAAAVFGRGLERGDRIHPLDGVRHRNAQQRTAGLVLEPRAQAQQAGGVDAGSRGVVHVDPVVLVDHPALSQRGEAVQDRIATRLAAAADQFDARVAQACEPWRDFVVRLHHHSHVIEPVLREKRRDRALEDGPAAEFQILLRHPGTHPRAAAGSRNQHDVAGRAVCRRLAPCFCRDARLSGLSQGFSSRCRWISPANVIRTRPRASPPCR